MQENLYRANAVPVQIFLEITDVGIPIFHDRIFIDAVRMGLFAVKLPDLSNQYILILGPVENSNLSPCRHLLHNSPEKIVRQLIR